MHVYMRHTFVHRGMSTCVGVCVHVCVQQLIDPSLPIGVGGGAEKAVTH